MSAPNTLTATEITRQVDSGTLTAEAPIGIEFTGDLRFSSIWTLAGTPCVTLAASSGASSLPLGMQLVGLRHADDRLLSIAA